MTLHHQTEVLPVVEVRHNEATTTDAAAGGTYNNMNVLEETMTKLVSYPPSTAPPSEDATSTISTDSTTTTTTTTAASVSAAAAATAMPSQQRVTAAVSLYNHQSSTPQVCATTAAAAAAAAAASVCRRLQGHVCVCEGCESTRSEMLSAGSQMHNNKRARLDNEEQKRQQEQQKKIDKMSEACRTILECMGEDPTREGLIKTPERWAKALLFMSSGYQISPDIVTNNAVFCENHHEMVVVRNISIHSLCEHHMLPFTGHVHIGYIPNGKVIGLSKLARIAELYARRLQVQERLTSQIADAILETVQPLGVAVVIECTHFCMVMRGVQKTSAVTTTSSVRGCFETNSKTRAEFFSILHGSSTRIEMR